MIDTLEDIDLSDMDLLDDKHAHARCTYCQPNIPLLATFEALCGKKAVHRRHHVGVPANACSECVKLWHMPCGRCGH